MTPWTAARQTSLSITNSWSLLKLLCIMSLMPSNHLVLCHPLLLSPSLFPSIRSFPMSQFLASGGPSIEVSASTLVLPMDIQDRFPLGWTNWISLQSKRLSRLFSNTTVQKHQFFSAQLKNPTPTFIVTTRKTIALTRQTFVGKVTSLLFNMPSRLVIAFLPRGKCLNFVTAVTICNDFGTPKNKLLFSTNVQLKKQRIQLYSYEEGEAEI